MVKRTCPDGQRWDNLLKMCHSRPMEPGPRTELGHGKEPSLRTAAVQNPRPTAKPVLDQVRTKTTLLPTVFVLSQTLWFCVILVTLASVMVLILWFVLFRRQTRVNRHFEAPVPEQDLLQKIESLVKFHPHREKNGHVCQGPAEASSPCHQMHPGVQTGPQWEDKFTVCRDPSRHGGNEAGGGLPACSTVEDHRVPLPATELGGTVLVTTKTL